MEFHIIIIIQNTWKMKMEEKSILDVFYFSMFWIYKTLEERQHGRQSHLIRFFYFSPMAPIKPNPSEIFAPISSDDDSPSWALTYCWFQREGLILNKSFHVLYIFPKQIRNDTDMLIDLNKWPSLFNYLEWAYCIFSSCKFQHEVFHKFFAEGERERASEGPKNVSSYN